MRFLYTPTGSVFFFFTRLRRVPFLYTWVVLFFSLGVTAQPQYTWYPSKVIDNSNGLLQNTINSMYFDKSTGFLWMATESGIARYDGVSTRIFDQRSNPDMKTSRVPSMFPLVEGGVMAMDRGGSVYSINGHIIKRQPRDSFITFNLITGNYKGSIASISRSSAILNLAVNHAKGYEKMADLITLPQPMLWLDTKHWISYTHDKFRFFEDSIFLHEWPKKAGELPLLIPRGGQIYALNNNGSGYLISPAEKKCQPLLINDPAFTGGKATVYYDRLNDQPLVLNGNRLYILQFSGDKVSTVFTGVLPSLPQNISGILMHPSQKFVFVSTWFTGLHIYNRSIFSTYRMDPSKLNAPDGNISVNNIYGSVLSGSKYVLTGSSVLYDLETGEGKFINDLFLQQYQLLKDKDQSVWYGDGDQLKRITLKGNTPVQDKSIHLLSLRGENIANYLVSLFQDSKGRIWVSTGQYLGYLDQDKIQVLIPYSADHVPFNNFSETGDGKLMATDNKGFVFIDPVKKTIERNFPQTISNLRFYMIDEEGYWWITTYGNGNYLYIPAQKKLYSLPADRNGYLLFSHYLAPDNMGNFIIPTNRGLFRINRKHLIELAGKQQGLFYQYFDIRSGLETNEFNGGAEPAYNRLENGDLLLPSFNGLVRVHVRELPGPKNYPIFIDHVEAEDGIMYEVTPGISFHSRQRNLVWKVAFGQWEQNYSPGFSYRLDNDTTWISLPDGERQIRLNGVDGGDHVLHIRFQSGFSAGAFSYLDTPFTIAKRYYETAWFWPAMIAALVALIWLGSRLQTWRLKRANTKLEKIVKEKTNELVEKNHALMDTLSDLEETVQDLNAALNNLQQTNLFKSRLIGIIGHDILIPLRYISKVSNQLQQHYGKLSKETTLESVGEISAAAGQLQFFSESILHWIRLQNREQHLYPVAVNLNTMIAEIKEFQLALLETKENELVNDTEPGLHFLQDATALKVILANLILFANRLTANGTIRIRAEVENRTLILQVSDDGKPMSEDIADSLSKLEPIRSSIGSTMESGWGMGYIMITDLIRLLNGSLKAERGDTRGNRITIQFPEARVAGISEDES